ncbi:MAG: hypothetical protein JSR77_00895 [Planctomycetes bacterium]|nr:hypothetical protein [Planctomycetota bacterium]
MNMLPRDMLVALGLAACALSTRPAHGQPTSTNSISLQAKLTGVPDGTASLAVKFYDSLTGGTQVGSAITLSAVPVQGGIVSVPVSPVDAGVFNGATRYMGISVNGGAELTPRTLVTSVPYAMASMGVWQVAESTGPRLTQHRLMLGSESAGNSNLVMQINNPNTAAARAIVQCVHSQGNAFGDLYLNPGGGIVYLPRDCIIGSDATGYPNLRVIANAQDTDMQATRSSGSSYGDIRLNPTAGNVTIAPQGTTTVKVLTITGGSDVAEPVAITPTPGVAKAAPGMVMVIDREHDGKLVPCSAAYDKAVAGVLSGANGLKPGMVLSAEGQPYAGSGNDTMPLAMSGRVWVRCDATTTPVSRGDALTTSVTPGHAMVALDESKRSGAVIGKAMTELRDGKGLVLVLVNLQ